MSKRRYRVPALAALLALALGLFLLALRGLREGGAAERPCLMAWREAEDADLFGGEEG